MGECFQTLNLTNAYLFAAALQDEEICRNVLEIALNRKITAGQIARRAYALPRQRFQIGAL